MKTTAWWALEEAKQSGLKHPMDWHWPRIAAWLLALVAFAALIWTMTWTPLP